MNPPERHQLLRDWETFASVDEEAFGEPIIIDHLEASADRPHAFASVFGNIQSLFKAQPWLVEEAGYGWAVERGAYRFPAEALNQWRLLNAIAGLTNSEDVQQRKAVAGIAARQSLSWRIAHADPYCASYRGWRFVVLPFGLDNLANLLMLALRAHPVMKPLLAQISLVPPGTGDWTAPGKGIHLLSLPLLDDTPLLVDSFAVHQMAQAHGWWNGATYTLAGIEDPVVRTLASIATDWVIGHEVGHALFHDGDQPSLERELLADRAGLVSLLSWTRPRDLAGLDPNLSDNFWDYLSARLVLLILTIVCGSEQEAATDAVLLDDIRARATGLRTLILEQVASTTLTTREAALIHALDDGFDRFAADLKALHAAAPPWAIARARHAARNADETVRRELAEHKAKGGGPIQPEPGDE